ncbi:hypothetical protein ACLQ16_03855 [Streptomyces albidoflavus]|uniref:hypothetical protein n=1 Tax=Streptomyces albidoflavus TaxID=1886 RepID=UPI000A1CE043|nr:hypothetical protein [Streptomyces albidoflavus]
MRGQLPQHLEGPSVNTLTVRLRALRPASAAVATVTAVALLLTGCSGGSDGTPACRTVHSKGGDLVPSGGARPCVVYGTGSGAHRPTDGGGTAAADVPAAGGSNRTTSKPKAPAAPKAPSAPKAPAAKAPAPVVKAPSLLKTR